jgi:hypothetical protein
MLCTRKLCNKGLEDLHKYFYFVKALYSVLRVSFNNFTGKLVSEKVRHTLSLVDASKGLYGTVCQNLLSYKLRRCNSQCK